MTTLDFQIYFNVCPVQTVPTPNTTVAPPVSAPTAPAGDAMPGTPSVQIVRSGAYSTDPLPCQQKGCADLVRIGIYLARSAHVQ